MSLHYYGKAQNHSMKDIYESLFNYIRKYSKKAEFNVTKLALRFSQEKSTKHKETMENATLGDDEWKYFNKLVRIYTHFLEYPETYNWSTKNIGSFLIKLFIWQFSLFTKPKPCANIIENKFVNLDALHKMFSIPGHDISLPDIGYMYSLIDYNKILTRTAHDARDLSRIILKPSFKECFVYIEQKYPKSKEFKSNYRPMNVSENLNIFPCLEKDQHPLCSDYCSWHEEFFNTSKKDIFITIMRYTLPLRKINLNPILPTEPKIAEQVFGTSKIRKNLEYLITKTSLVAFCHQKLEGFIGENIGISDNVCADFFPAPTDAGICLTKNLDLKNIMKINKVYDKIFEKGSQNSHIKGGTIWSETTLIVNTGNKLPLSQNYPRESNVVGGDIQFQLHESKEIANILLDKNYNKYTTSLNLQNGYEYWIDVTPTGKISTKGFKVS